MKAKPPDPGWRGPAGLRRRFDALVDEAGLDTELARGWTLLRAVDYQLWV